MKEIFIVESITDLNELKPCLEKFLDKNAFEILVCKGHVREIREGNTYKKVKDYGIDLSTFEPDYEIKDDSKSIISNLKKQIKDADMVYLVTDQDREGEAIAWHLKEVLELKKYKRMPCYEYTYKTVKKAYDNAGEINMALVESQESRAVLDKLVGYDISPLIQKKFYINYLSGGRIQSIALKIVCDREKEIENFIPVEYFDISVDLKKSKNTFNAKLIEFNNKKIAEKDIKSQEILNDILLNLDKANYILTNLNEEEKSAFPVRPFKATTMQKAAPWDPDKTMSLAQKLKGKNLITYHRTDSTRVPDDKLFEAKEFIEKNYGSNYSGKYIQPKKEKGVQDGHVAIMPTDIEKTPNSDIIKALPSDEAKLYNLIWRQFVGAMMTPEKYNLTTAIINANDCKFRAYGSVTTFDGASKVLKQNDSKRTPLPKMKIGDVLELVKLNYEKKKTNPPSRYDERTLAAKLDEEKIGRPSTISTYPKTLKQRRYVYKDMEDKKLHPTELGINVCEGLSEYIKSIMNIKFTSMLEEQLDEIADGDLSKVEMLKEFYPKFCDEIKVALVEMEKPVELDEKCPKCGANLQVKYGKYGKFKCCTNYPRCNYSEDLKPEPKLVEGTCPECGGKLQERLSRFGKFIGCSNYPKCKYIQRDTNDTKKDLGPCPKCNEGHIEVKRSRKGNFYGCSNYPKCDFATWYEPTNEKCQKCGYPLGIHKTRTVNELKCINKNCSFTKKA